MFNTGRSWVGLAGCLIACTGFASTVEVKLDFNKKGHEIPKTLYGIFYEDINYAADGGLYPELIANRGFDWTTKGLEGWVKDYRGGAMARITRQLGKPVHPNTATYLRIETFGAGEGCGVKNNGYSGIAVKQGEKYDLSFYARAFDHYKGTIRIVLEVDGKELARHVVANGDLSISSPNKDGIDVVLPDWKKYSTVLVPNATATNASLSVLMDKAGTIDIELVSLFPQDTFAGRKNGLRKDLVQLLKDMKPGVMRFPGGCIIEGGDFGNWYDWKRTVGPIERREINWNRWGYWQTHGLGYFEYFQLSEDIGAEPMPILAAGMTCQFANAELAPIDSMEYFIQNALDLIEFANGDVNTKWGKVRADMGHPKPFNMKYLGVGNENWDQVFLDRYLVIDRGIRAKHPEIKIISSAGAGPSGPRYDLAWKFLIESKADLVDEHYYVKADWLLSNATRYDQFDRKGPKVYAGEYACHLPNRANSLYSAISEAAMMTGFERNSDIVVMTSYAPLFGKVAHDQWKPDLIWYDNVRSFGSPNFYVQKLFASNLPTTLIPSTCNAQSVPMKPAGCIGIQTWNTVAEFKDITVTKGSETLYAYKPDLKGWSKTKDGKWIVKDGALRQTVPDKSNTGIVIGEPTWSDYTLTLKARKISGDEGFIVRFRDGGNRNVHLNLGGWGNQSHGLEAGQGNIIGGKKAGRIESDKWYDIKIVLVGDKVSAWLDNEVICKDVVVETASTIDFFTVSGFDKDAGEIVVKCINAAESDRPLKLDFGTQKLQAQKAKRITLSGEANVVNDLDNPTRCAPVLDTVDVTDGSVFTTTLKPMSMTVFRFKK